MTRQPLLAAVLAATLAACTGGDKKAVPAEPVQPAADEAAVDDDGDSIATEAAVDTGASEVAEDSTDDLPPAPTGIGASLSQLKTTETGDASSGHELWVLVDHLIVRSGPSSKAPQVGGLEYGERVLVSAQRAGFAKIGDGRWVARRLLTDRRAKFVPHPAAVLAH